MVGLVIDTMGYKNHDLNQNNQSRMNKLLKSLFMIDTNRSTLKKFAT